jgi:hypothetical protein
MNPGMGRDMVQHHAADLRRLAADRGSRTPLGRRIARPVGLALVRVGRRLAGADEREIVVPTRTVLRAVRG